MPRVGLIFTVTTKVSALAYESWTYHCRTRLYSLSELVTYWGVADIVAGVPEPSRLAELVFYSRFFLTRLKHRRRIRADSPLRRAVLSTRSAHPLRRTVTYPGLVTNPIGLTRGLLSILDASPL